MNMSYSTVPHSTVLCVNVDDLPYDMRRVLRMQFKEFINLVEDKQLGASSSNSGGDLASRMSLTQGRFNNQPTSSSAAA